MLQLPERSFAGYIFDCDGTLVDSMPIHYVCWVEALKVNGATFDFTEEEFYDYAGIREQDTVILLNEKHGTSVDPDAVAETKAALFRRRIPEVPMVRPVAEFAISQFGKTPMSVASGSEAPTVNACLEATGLLKLFPHIVTPANVKRGKPAPDMFLLAAQLMGVPPEDCLVFEDGRSGLEAARAAGMQAVYVPRTLR